MGCINYGSNPIEVEAQEQQTNFDVENQERPNIDSAEES